MRIFYAAREMQCIRTDPDTFHSAFCHLNDVAYFMLMDVAAAAGTSASLVDLQLGENFDYLLVI